MNAFLKDCLGCNSIPFQFNEVNLNMMISGTDLPGSSPSPVTVTTPAAASETIQASGDPGLAAVFDLVLPSRDVNWQRPHWRQ